MIAITAFSAEEKFHQIPEKHQNRSQLYQNIIQKTPALTFFKDPLGLARVKSPGQKSPGFFAGLFWAFSNEI